MLFWALGFLHFFYFDSNPNNSILSLLLYNVYYYIISCIRTSWKWLDFSRNFTIDSFKKAIFHFWQYKFYKEKTCLEKLYSWFTATAFNQANKTFVVYITAILRATTKRTIYQYTLIKKHKSFCWILKKSLSSQNTLMLCWETLLQSYLSIFASTIILI